MRRAKWHWTTGPVTYNSGQPNLTSRLREWPDSGPAHFRNALRLTNDWTLLHSGMNWAIEPNTVGRSLHLDREPTHTWERYNMVHLDSRTEDASRFNYGYVRDHLPNSRRYLH